MKGVKTGGRQAGTPNKTTKEIRTVIQEVVSSNSENINEWINKVAENEPEKAIKLLIELSNFVIPKVLPTRYIKKGSIFKD